MPLPLFARAARRPLFFILALSAAAIGTSAQPIFTPNATTCPVGARVRPCTYMEPALLPAGTAGGRCLCPGATLPGRSEQRFSLTVAPLLVPLPAFSSGAAAGTKSLYAVNGSWPVSLRGAAGQRLRGASRAATVSLQHNTKSIPRNAPPSLPMSF